MKSDQHKYFYKNPTDNPSELFSLMTILINNSVKLEQGSLKFHFRPTFHAFITFFFTESIFCFVSYHGLPDNIPPPATIPYVPQFKSVINGYEGNSVTFDVFSATF